MLLSPRIVITDNKQVQNSHSPIDGQAFPDRLNVADCPLGRRPSLEASPLALIDPLSKILVCILQATCISDDTCGVNTPVTACVRTTPKSSDLAQI